MSNEFVPVGEVRVLEGEEAIEAIREKGELLGKDEEEIEAVIGMHGQGFVYVLRDEADNVGFQDSPMAMLLRVLGQQLKGSILLS